MVKGGEMSLSVMQRSAAEVGIGCFVPKKQEALGLYADARAELEKNPLLSQILANFEAQHRLLDLAGDPCAVVRGSSPTLPTYPRSV